MWLLKLPEKDRPKDDNSNTFAHTPNNHIDGIVKRPYHNGLENNEDLIDVNIEVAINFLNTLETYSRNIIMVEII